MVSSLSDQEIIEQIGMANLPKIIHTLYEKYDGQYQLIDIGNDCMFRFGETNVANVSYLATYIHFIEINNNILRIEGNVSWPAVLKDKFSLQILVNQKAYDLKLYDKNLDLQDEGRVYENRDVFVFEYKLEACKTYELQFQYMCNGIASKSGKINAMRFSPVADVIENQYAYRSGWGLYIRGSALCIVPMGEEQRLLYEQEYQRGILNDTVKSVRNAYWDRRKKKKKPIWLFMDRVDKADDNGEAFFAYVMQQKNCPAECYFIISKDCADYGRISKIGNVIPAMSEEHQIYQALADYIFTSQLNGWAENPYGKTEEYFRDIYHQAKVVFLQHGVTKDDQTKWLNRYNQNLHAIVTSSEREKESFLDYPYHYEEHQIWNVGMPRLDRLYSNGKKNILFMPTWRQEVMEQRYDAQARQYRWCLKENFKESQYYKVYHEVLNNKWFIWICKCLGYRITFMPHPIMQPYKEAFEVDKRVEILSYDTSWRDLFANSRIMVTDYSSVAFDYAYLQKPLIYFQFDREEFFKHHTYKEGYFNYEADGFGPVVQNEKQLVRLIVWKIIIYKKTLKYYKRTKDFYDFMRGNCCQKILEKVYE